jgi:hypothetical protein
LKALYKASKALHEALNVISTSKVVEALYKALETYIRLFEALESLMGAWESPERA